MICVWDLRLSNSREGTQPVIVMPKAHVTGTSDVRKGKLSAPLARGVTSLVFSPNDPHTLISGGSYDG